MKKHFPDSKSFRDWLAQNHDKAKELFVVYYKRETKKASITWPQSVEQALCFGWIDGVRRRIDDERYEIRFTPRKPRSIWSQINLKMVESLKARGLMHPAGLAAHANHDPDRTRRYSFEQRKQIQMPPAYQEQLKANKAALKYFQSKPPWYRRTATFWVVSAKQEQTRLKRLSTLIECCEKGIDVPPLRRRTVE